MKQCLSLVIFFLFIQTISGQLEYQKGYFIDNEGIRTECYIYNKDWNNNPTAIKLRIDEGGVIYTGGISAIKEFGIYDNSKFIRAIVKIDRSGDITSQLRQGYNPVWTDDTLFLKVLVEGKASLYYYAEGSVKKFFYSTAGSGINQLVYKRFLLPDNSTVTDLSNPNVYWGANKPNIAINRDYLKQLWLEVRCPEDMPVKNVEYDISDLKKYFREYNKCTGGEYRDYSPSQGKLSMHLKVVPGISISSLSILNSAYVNTVYSNRNLTFSTKPIFTLSIASEVVLPFNKNKWALLFEPSFQYYHDEKILSRQLSKTETATIQFKSIEFPVGVRYYFYLDNGFRVSMAALMIPSQSLNFNSYLAFGNNDPLKIKPAANFAFSGGADYKRISVELRYYTNRHLMLDFVNWHTNYQRISLMLGYRIF